MAEGQRPGEGIEKILYLELLVHAEGKNKNSMITKNRRHLSTEWTE